MSDAAVFIPVFNGEKYLDELLRALAAQRAPGGVEVLVIDSGSSDRSLEIARAHAVRLVQIPNAEFGHGRTRNLALRLTRAPFVAFLTQDATPASDRWLAELLAPFADPRVAATYGAQLPRASSDPTTARIVAEAYGRFGPLTVDSATADRPIFSSVNSCVRRAAWESIPFRDVPYAEDFYLADDLLRAGFVLGYAPKAAVRHSNEYTLAEYWGRMVDEFGALPPSQERLLEARLLKRWVVETARDVAFAWRRSPARLPSDAGWALVAQTERLAAAYLRHRHPGFFHRVKARFSLEGRKRATR
jgi:rhamnosyltransferase